MPQDGSSCARKRQHIPRLGGGLKKGGLLLRTEKGGVDGTMGHPYGGLLKQKSLPDHRGRDVAAMLCRRWTTATLRELSRRFGLSHSDSASDLIKRGVQQAKQNRNTARRVTSIERALGLNPETQVLTPAQPP